MTIAFVYFIAIIISLIVTFISLWLLITIFDPGIEDKIKRIVVLTIIMVILSSIGDLFGFFGILLTGIINFILIMKILGYDFVTTFLFAFGLRAVHFVIILVFRILFTEIIS